MSIAVNERSEEVKALAAQWTVLDALLGGTPAMRAAGEAYLPKWPNEDAASYQARLATATLMPSYRRTVRVLSGKPFSRPLTVSDAPASIEQWAEDVDLQGVNLHSFASEMFEEAFYGLAGILVEYPRVVPVKSGRTVAQVEASGARPYFVRVRHSQILGWRTESAGGRVRLGQLRLLETAEEPDGAYGVAYVPQVRVLFPGGWELWRESAKAGEWAMHDSGITSLPYIPYIPVYGIRSGFMCGSPPLLDLAYLNVKHWQSQSDQDTILHVARVPILAVKGVDDDFTLTVGSSAAVNLGDGPNAELVYVEHTGAAIEAGGKSLSALEEQMIQTGAELLVQKPGARTATEDANDAEGNKCDLQRMAEAFEDALDQALQVMADYARLGAGGSVSLFKDYGAASLSDASAQLIQTLQQGGLISKATAINELKRRGVLSQEVTADDEAELVASDGPALDLADAGTG